MTRHRTGNEPFHRSTTHTIDPVLTNSHGGLQ